MPAKCAKGCKEIHSGFENAVSAIDGRAQGRQREHENAFERSLDILGEPSKKALLFYLTHTFKVPVKDCSVEEIEGALKKILGEGASIVVASITDELGQRAN